MLIICYFILINVFSFVLFGLDKHKAKKRLWRIPEKALFLFSVLGGSIGAIFGMYVFRHKTKHLSFKLGLPIILLVQLVLVLVFIFIL